jgi:hypothetical protein
MKRPHGIVIALVTTALLAASPLGLAQTVTRLSLLAEMADSDAVARFPQPRYGSFQASRYNRASTNHILLENRTADPAEPAHENIGILHNWFQLTGNNAISAKSTRGLTITGNPFSSAELLGQTRACTEMRIESNTDNAKE